jgi:hypothetical protein
MDKNNHIHPLLFDGRLFFLWCGKTCIGWAYVLGVSIVSWFLWFSGRNFEVFW